MLRWLSTSDRLKSEAQILLQVGRDNLKKVQVVMWEIKSGDHFLVDKKKLFPYFFEDLKYMLH